MTLAIVGSPDNMRYQVAGQEVRIRIIRTDQDVQDALDFFATAPDYALCVDTETTGLDIFSPDFRIRTLQIGGPRLAFVYPLKSARDRTARRLLYAALERGVNLHNAPFDLLAMDVTGLAPLADTEDHYHDTKLMAHLLDPRSKMDGGIGFGLKSLCAAYIDPNAPDTQNDLKEVFKSEGWTMDTGWANIDINNPTYLLYAGLDVILGSRLHKYLRAKLNKFGHGRLARFEHELQRVTTRMQKRGFRVDVDAARVLLDRLARQNEQGILTARQLGVDNINSTAQIADALTSMGWEPEEFTNTGKPKVDKAVLAKIAESEGSPRDLANAIISAKRAAKWAKAYAQAMLDARDPWDHVHPSINSLQARTGRMSISNPPLQQLPSRGDDAWIIRRMVIADEGMVIGSADYDQVEFRVLAALADIQNMKQAVYEGVDLHNRTAELVYGPSFTKGQRSVLKAAGFGRVFGGGARTLARQTGISEEQAAEVIRAYDQAYVELPAYTRQLQREAKLNGGYILNYHGRYLPVDKGREYAAVNYSVQSIARDLLAQALIDLARAGLDDCLLLPIHDEVLFQAPREDAEEVAHCVGDIMSGTFIDVPISATGEIYGTSWAEGYVAYGDDGRVYSKGSGNEITDWIPT